MANKKEKEMEVTTPAQVTRESDMAVKTAEQERKALARQFMKQDTVPIQVSPLYQPYFGRVMTVTINGTSIAIPCNGKTYQVPATFAEEIKVRIYKQDQLLMKKRRMSRVTENFEASPGELQLF
jgi:1-acyl-sn-glycerol-3-phosphate acyltransferase